ncbi:MAG: putative toxin-antitoxin system toxin component, PIN family [Firmicutes bacterium]|nr:putative toxin-antitoxin system toxin component, PIN family [Bacillota bacterium]
MKIYAVIDTNVIVSAVLSKKDDAATVIVLKAVFTGKIIPVYNDDIIAEYKEVLKRKKFKLDPDTVDGLVNSIKEAGETTERIITNETLPDPDDLVFYEVAVSKENSFLITGNIKHFPDKHFIVTPAEMTVILNKLNML